MKRPINYYELVQDDSHTNMSAKKLSSADNFEVDVYTNMDYVIINFATVFSFTCNNAKCNMSSSRCDGN